MKGQSPSQPASTSYFIRTRGRVQGPLSAAKLKLLRARGQFGRASEVSLDGLLWSPASAFAELFDAPPAPATTATNAASLDEDPSPRRPDLVTSKPASPARNWKPIVLAGGLLSLSMTVVLTAWLATQQSGRSVTNSATGVRSTPFPSINPSAEVIASAIDADEETAREAAIGLVVCGIAITLTDGTVKEIAISRGTAFLVSADGAAITNRHVVEETASLNPSESASAVISAEVSKVLGLPVVSVEPQVWVFFGGERHSAEVVHVSDRFDLAVLHTDHRRQPHFALSVEDTTSRSEPIYALGFPGAADIKTSAESAVADEIAREVMLLAPKSDLRVEKFLTDHSYEFTLSDGLVSRRPYVDDDVIWIQHTAAINPGNSGGPLVLEDGLVVGINTMLASEAQGIFIALATSQLRDEIDAHAPGVVWR